jgi:hypothetical protein
MQRSLSGLALRGAFGALMIAGGLVGAPAFAASSHAHSHDQGHKQGGDTPAVNGHAKLEHTPSGTASLTWDATSHQLTVNLSLTGLAPSGSYTANIEQGKCDKGGTVAYALTNPTVDAHGAGTSQTTLSNVTSRIPEHNWYVAVNQGSAMVACGKVHDVHHKGDKGDKGDKGHMARQNGKESAKQSGTDTASAKLGPTKDPNQHVGGEAHLQLKGGTLTVDMRAHGLTSGATYPVEIGQGSCASLGSSPVYTLNPLTRNIHGDWVSTTAKSGVASIPQGQWYVAVWSADHSDLLACGNVRAEGHD